MRYALLVATGEYEDARLSRLRAPAQDVERLAAVLEDPDVGGFTDVRVLRDRPDHEIRRAVEDVLAARTPDDLVLVYFSCHGLSSPSRRLYFAAANTVQDRPAGTAIPRSFLNEQLEDCRASGRVLILDCCFSGAYVEGFKAAAPTVLDDDAVGSGYVVLTASNAFEYAFEEDALSVEAPVASIFTNVLIEGLAGGGADLDGDGRVDVAELFRYAQREVSRRRPDQNPQFFAHGAGGAIVLARTGGGETPASVRRTASYTPGQLLVARGFRAAAEPVVRTLGPYGRRAVVFVDRRPVELADAAAIAAAFTPDDPRDDLGADYVRELIDDVHAGAGDGGATAVAVARGALARLVEAMRKGHNPVRLMQGVRAAAVRAVELIRSSADVSRDVLKLAVTASADAEVGGVIARVANATGRGGAVLVEEGKAFGIDYEILPGLRFPGGYASGVFVTDPARREAVLTGARVLLVTGELPYVAFKLLTELMADEQVLVVCERLPHTVLGAIVALGGRVVVVKAEAADLHRAQSVVAGVVLDADMLSGADARHFGHADHVVVTRHDTTLLRRFWPGTPPSDAAAGVIRVPAADLPRVERAVRAIRTAAAEGVLRGGGVGLRLLGEQLAADATGSDAQVAGWLALAAGLAEPSALIAENAAVPAEDLDPTLVDSAGTARVVVEAATRTLTRFLLVG